MTIVASGNASRAPTGTESRTPVRVLIFMLKFEDNPPTLPSTFAQWPTCRVTGGLRAHESP